MFRNKDPIKRAIKLQQNLCFPIYPQNRCIPSTSPSVEKLTWAHSDLSSDNNANFSGTVPNLIFQVKKAFPLLLKSEPTFHYLR